MQTKEGHTDVIGQIIIPLLDSEISDTTTSVLKDRDANASVSKILSPKVQPIKTTSTGTATDTKDLKDIMPAEDTTLAPVDAAKTEDAPQPALILIGDPPPPISPKKTRSS